MTHVVAHGVMRVSVRTIVPSILVLHIIAIAKLPSSGAQNLSLETGMTTVLDKLLCTSATYFDGEPDWNNRYPVFVTASCSTVLTVTPATCFRERPLLRLGVHRRQKQSIPDCLRYRMTQRPLNLPLRLSPQLCPKELACRDVYSGTFSTHEIQLERPQLIGN